MNNKAFKILISFLAVYIIWGSTYLAIRVIVDTGPAFISMGFRFTIAALLIYLVLLFQRKAKFNKKQFINSSIIGILLFAGGTGLVAWSEKYIPSGIACVMVSLLPLWFLLFDMIMNKAKMPRFLVWLGVIIGFAGILLLVGFKDLANMKNVPYLPFFIILIATIIWSFGAILSPKLEKPKNNLLNLSIQMFSGGIVNFLIGIIIGESSGFEKQAFDLESLLALLYLIIFGSILAMSAFTYLIDNVTPGMLSTYSYVNPVVALFLGWLILNEEINSQIIIASTLILIGVAFIKMGDRSLKPISLKRIQKGNKSSK